MVAPGAVTIRVYAGLFLVTLATLMYEILLTRIFSVTMWYHFAFLAISVAMFGMTVGAIVTYLRPAFFTRQRAGRHLAASALLFAVTSVLSFLVHLSIPFVVHKSLVGVVAFALNYAVIAVPFVFSGICVSLALTKFPEHVGRLYAVDLAGAACGCIVTIWALELTDGPTAVVVVAALAALGSLLFALDTTSTRLRRGAATSCAVLVLFGFANTALAGESSGLVRLVWVKSELEEAGLYEKWNSFSRIRVDGTPERLQRPSGWGLSAAYPLDKKVRELSIQIDAAAATVLTRFTGDLSELEHLKYGVTNVGHYLRPQSNVLVVGVGGGRDVLAALAFDQQSIVGVELNGAIIDVVNDRFGDYTGHLDRHPKVTFVNDEARSYIARTDEKFDIIQLSLIDTWAATAAGAFVLSENGLYTVEAWRSFMHHLTPRGLLTVSRWYSGNPPREMYRTAMLASSVLLACGVEDPSRHIAVIRRMLSGGDADTANGMGTILVSREPFTEEDIDRLTREVERLQFDLVFSPRNSMDGTLTRIASGRDLDAFTAGYCVNIAPPTDESPFFFHMLRLRDVFDSDLWGRGSRGDVNLKAVIVLGIALVTVFVLTALCILLPLLFTADRPALRGAGPLFLFFMSIGLGFMLIEISQMQRLIIFLGHPVYGLSVVLFAVLLGGGLGSATTQRVGARGQTTAAVGRLLALLLVLLIVGLATWPVIRQFEASVTAVRVAVAVALVFPIGFFMGMAFPLGMQLAARRSEAITPWLWGINGAMSVTASVLAVAIALTFGVSASFWVGFGCYALAAASFIWASNRERYSYGV